MFYNMFPHWLKFEICHIFKTISAKQLNKRQLDGQDLTEICFRLSLEKRPCLYTCTQGDVRKLIVDQINILYPQLINISPVMYYNELIIVFFLQTDRKKENYMWLCALVSFQRLNDMGIA